MPPVAPSVSRFYDRPATATLINGDEVVINDHVYFAPPWSERDGSPYSIARIIEFLPSTAAKYTHTSHKASSNEQHVRLALFYRPSEISGRMATDHRLLLAAIHSEVHPLSWLRGKCWVRHREKIENIHEWKKRADHFHYSRLFDPYIRREFDMIRTVTVTNVPEYIRKILVKRYEFLVTEKEMAADLQDAYRTCRTCHEWASSQDSVRCEMCKNWYHMECVNPPLAAKPSRGYSWMCSPCMHDRAVRDGRNGKGSSTNGHPAPPPAPPPPVTVNQLTLSRTIIKTRAAKEKAAPIDYEKPDAYYRGWNFRYFGQYTVAEHAIDPDDPIFPRQVTRLGQRYQTNVPSWEEQQAMEKQRLAAPPDPDLPIRGVDDDGGTLVLKSRPDPANQIAVLSATRTAKVYMPLVPNTVEAIGRALALVLQYKDKNLALEAVNDSKLVDYGSSVLYDLDERELGIFESEIARWSCLEAHETAKKVGRQPWEIIRYYFKWRNEKLIDENASMRAEMARTKSETKRQRLSIVHNMHDPPEVPVVVKKRIPTPKGKGRFAAKPARKAVTGVQLGASAILGHGREATPESDAEGSVWEDSDLREQKPSCASCGARKDGKWWKASRSHAGGFLCDHCGVTYRKYGHAQPLRTHLDRAGEKRGSTPMEEPPSKRQKTGATAKAVSPPPPLPPVAKNAPCAFCLKVEPKPMARCGNCTFAVHPGCYGMPKEDAISAWLCDPCANEKVLEASLDITCVLCPKQLPNLRRPLVTRPKVLPDFDFLQAIKPTEGYKWAHVLCSTYVPDLQWSDGKYLRLTEGIMSLPHRRMERCEICLQAQDGMVMQCSDCVRTFHASCGWLAGFNFGFEVIEAPDAKPAKKGNAMPTMITFRGKTGILQPVCQCPSHRQAEGVATQRQIFEINDIDPTTGLSALQTYAITGGQAPRNSSFGLLRKARRLEDIIPAPAPRPESVAPTLPAEQACTDCAATFSPRWYPIDSNPPNAAGDAILSPSQPQTSSVICHQCHFRRRATE